MHVNNVEDANSAPMNLMQTDHIPAHERESISHVCISHVSHERESTSLCMHFYLVLSYKFGVNLCYRNWLCTLVYGVPIRTKIGKHYTQY